MLKSPSGASWAFDSFQLLTDKRLLLADGRPVPLMAKAFDTLVLLVENRDRVVSKDELLRAIWPDVIVEEGNLTQQIFVLRKALGESAQQPRYILTVPGHGYRFTAPVTEISPSEVSSGEVSTGQSRRWTMWAGLIVGIVTVATVIAFMLKKAASPPSGDWTDMAGVGIHKTTETGKATHATLSRDGRYVAHVESDGDEFSLHVQQLGTGGTTQVVPPQPLLLASLRFSNNGEFLYFTRAPRYKGGPVLSRIPSIGGAETAILDDVNTPISFSPDGRHFVFMRGAGTQTHLVIAQSDGGAQRILATRSEPLAFSFAAPAWSPDGNWVAASTIDQSKGNRASIVLLPIAGGTPRELYSRAGRIGALRWLHDGSGVLAVMTDSTDQQTADRQGSVWRIAYPAGTAERLTPDLTLYHLCCVDVDDSGRIIAGVVHSLVSDLSIASVEQLDRPRQVTSGNPIVGRHSWLPDNDTIVYRDLNGRLNAVQKNGRTFRLAVPDGLKVVGGVSACGDGRHVVFQGVPGDNIWRVTPTAGDAKQLTHGVWDGNPGCSPDGKWVVYSSRVKGVRSIWRISIDGGEPVPLVPDETPDALPSPRGRLLYYVGYAWDEHPVPFRRVVWNVISSDSSKRLYRFDNPENRDLGKLPIWAPDDTGLDYVATTNGVSNIWRQPLTDGPPVQITNFNTGTIFGFAWSPDGKWLSLATGMSRSDVVVLTRK